MNRLSETTFRNGRPELDEKDSEGNDDHGNETCNECGQSVCAGSGKFASRVIDFSGYKTRREMGKPYPSGDYLCAECETELDAQPGQVLQLPGREEEELK